MPTYEYKCEECTSRYEIFHKVREVEEDIVCPSCNSKKHVRLMSATAVSMSGYTSSSSSSYSDSSHTCSGGGCCGGSCSN